MRRTGLLRRRFPIHPPHKKLSDLSDWKNSTQCFFFKDKHDISLTKKREARLKGKYIDIRDGQFELFSSVKFRFDNEDEWTTNPDNGYVFDKQKHWTAIADFSEKSGDIKYVWERSRFSFLYDIIRYDYHYDEDCSEHVISRILSWIDNNPLNCGPNYRCSQEISVRVMNWIFALHYYKHSIHLTEDAFQKIMYSMYWQIEHVYANIQFSLVAVRNNHAVSETLALYLFGLLFPENPSAKTWMTEGKRLFENEIEYQIYPDGTYLQFSTNYHRVVVQLLTWAIRLSELNGEMLRPVVKERAAASLQFLLNCMNPQTGHLPNYGANDGALFFPLNNTDFRDFRPQLNALSMVLGKGTVGDDMEDSCWYGAPKNNGKKLQRADGISSYEHGGYHLLVEKDMFTFIRCGNHKDRPSQADNLHLDLWIRDVNVLRDSGSYKYNADEETIKYFFGTESHNTVMLGDHDQMKKGRRFIWFYWTQSVAAKWTNHKNYFEFDGTIQAFHHIQPNITHSRCVKKFKSQWKWEVTDFVSHNTPLPLRQIWHPNNTSQLKVIFSAVDAYGNAIAGETKDGWYSERYGVREKCDTVIFTTATNKIITTIEVRERRK